MVYFMTNFSVLKEKLFEPVRLGKFPSYLCEITHIFTSNLYRK